jgi:hypothetical protein
VRLDIGKELAALEQMTVGPLHDRYVEVFGKPVRSRHRQYLIRRIACRLQANAEGGLSERALRRAEQLANIADVRVTSNEGDIGRPEIQTDLTDTKNNARAAALPEPERLANLKSASAICLVSSGCVPKRRLGTMEVGCGSVAVGTSRRSGTTEV